MTALLWQLAGALNVALMIRAYRPRFCQLLWLEFGPKTPGAACHPAGSGSAPACAHPLLGGTATQPAVPSYSRSAARQAPNVHT